MITTGILTDIDRIETGRLKDIQTDRHTDRHDADVKKVATLMDDLNVLVCRNGNFGHCRPMLLAT